MLEERATSCPTVDVKKNMLDACFIYRRFISMFREDRLMTSSISLLWMYLVVTIDWVVAQKQAEVKRTVDNMEETI